MSWRGGGGGGGGLIEKETIQNFGSEVRDLLERET